MSLIKKKICLLGDVGVGKTSMVRRFIENLFDDSYLTTIGVKVSQKKVSLAGSKEILLMIWDIEGAGHQGNIYVNYLSGAAGALIVTDLTRLDTIDDCKDIIKSFLEVNPEAPFILIGNKKDLITEKHPGYILFKKMAESLQVPFYYTSAKNGQNVEDSFYRISKKLFVD